MYTSLKNLTDEALIELITANNEHATATFLHRYKSKFYTTVYLLVKDPYIAEDIFQDGCIKIIQSIRQGKYTDNGKFISWAMRIIRNLAMDYLRSAKRHVKVTLPDGSDIFSVLQFEVSPVEDKIMLEESGDKARQLLAQLPYEQREVIVLRIFGNLSFNEIAQLTQVSVNTALGRMRYGLINLRKVIAEKAIVL